MDFFPENNMIPKLLQKVCIGPGVVFGSSEYVSNVLQLTSYFTGSHRLPGAQAIQSKKGYFTCIVWEAISKNLKNMDDIEDEYLVLPLHTKMDINHVEKICDVIKSGW